MAQFPSTTSASDVWSLTDVYRAKAGGNWPITATVPGAPTSVNATAGNAQATVTFAAPASDGGATITGYRVTSSPGGLTATNASSPITITGLTNGTSYTFTVAAQNSVGYGAESTASNSVTPAAPTNWTRILNNGGDTSTSGTVNVTGYSEILVFGVAPGGNGGGGGDDDGGGGGGSGAAQLSGYMITLTGGVTTLYYSTPAPVAANSTANPGNYQSNLQLRNTNSSGTLIFELNAGRNGACNPSNSTTPAPGGTGGASNSYSSTAGVNGGSGSTRLPSGSGSNANVGSGSSGTCSAGGGGAGAWYVTGNNTSAGARGGLAGSGVTVSTYGGTSLDVAFTTSFGSQGAGGAGYSSSTPGGNATTANGGANGPTYAGGGGAGAGLRFFGTGNQYGNGGGGGGGQQTVGGGGGKGGAAYLVIYAR